MSGQGRDAITARLREALSIDPWEAANGLWQSHNDTSGFAECVRQGYAIPDELRELIARILCGEANAPKPGGTRNREEALLLLRRGILSRMVKKHLRAVPQDLWPYSSEKTLDAQTAAIVEAELRGEFSQIGLDSSKKITANTVKADTKPKA